MAREKVPQQQDKDLLKHYFGFSDAADEDDLEKLFLKTPEFEDLKYGQRTKGNFVITGCKGSGKTAICNYLDKTSSTSLTWKVDNQNRFVNVHVKDLGKYPSEVESILVNLVLGELTRRVVISPDAFPADGVALTKELLPKLPGVFMKVAKAAKVKAGGFEVDIEKVLEEDRNRFAQFDSRRYERALQTCFAKRPALVLFDDIDDTFLGADDEKYSSFVEGLIRAAKSINLAYGKAIHFLVFLKYGLFRSFYERPRDYDKVRNYIVVLKWNELELERMLARRIADRQGTDPNADARTILATVFRPSSAITSIREFLFERCSSGPRDVIDYCNQAVERAGKPEITLDILRECEIQFSKDKLIQIYGDYGYTYPDIHKIIEMSFQGARALYESEEFRNFVFTKVLGESKIAELYGKHSYFETANVDKMIQILYTVGFIGYVSPSTHAPVYVLNEPRGADLFDAEAYVIHPAFRRGLRAQGGVPAAATRGLVS